jgi:hypothetical protein
MNSSGMSRSVIRRQIASLSLFPAAAAQPSLGKTPPLIARKASPSAPEGVVIAWSPRAVVRTAHVRDPLSARHNHRRAVLDRRGDVKQAETLQK